MSLFRNACRPIVTVSGFAALLFSTISAGAQQPPPGAWIPAPSRPSDSSRLIGPGGRSTVIGTVLYPNGSPAGGATVGLYAPLGRPSPDYGASLIGTTDAQGKYRIGGVYTNIAYYVIAFTPIVPTGNGGAISYQYENDPKTLQVPVEYAGRSVKLPLIQLKTQNVTDIDYLVAYRSRLLNENMPRTPAPRLQPRVEPDYRPNTGAPQSTGVGIPPHRLNGLSYEEVIDGQWRRQGVFTTTTTPGTFFYAGQGYGLPPGNHQYLINNAQWYTNASGVWYAFDNGRWRRVQGAPASARARPAGPTDADASKVVIEGYLKNQLSGLLSGLQTAYSSQIVR
jgi:hypothetical protein